MHERVGLAMGDPDLRAARLADGRAKLAPIRMVGNHERQFDAALARPDATLTPVAFDRAALRAHADALPAILRELAGKRAARPLAANVAAAAIDL